MSLAACCATCTAADIVRRRALVHQVDITLTAADDARGSP